MMRKVTIPMPEITEQQNPFISDRLLELLRDRAFVREQVTLSSGKVSRYYVDSKMVQALSEGAFLLGEVIYDRTKNLEFGALGGPATGAISIVTAALMCYHAHGRTMQGFWVRAEAKTHGTRKRVDGYLAPGARVVIVDDVVSSGDSVMTTIKEVKRREAEVVRIISVVDRLAGAAERFAALGYAYHPVCTLTSQSIFVRV